MNPDPIADAVCRIVAKQAMIPVEAVALTASPAELGLDSLGLVESIFAIEEEFDISVPFNANAGGTRDFDISTIGSVVAAVRTLVQARG
jgi:acyl carrier protein